MNKIFLSDRSPTSLKFYVGVITLFEESSAALVCNNVMVLAEDEHVASVEVARKWPDWELQSLTCISDLPWFRAIILGKDSPDIQALRTFVIPDVEAVPIDD
jgi:hypothetical protein